MFIKKKYFQTVYIFWMFSSLQTLYSSSHSNRKGKTDIFFPNILSQKHLY